MSSFDAIIKQKMKAWNDPDLMNPAGRGEKIPFSSPLVNWATYGGIPRNKITEFFGQPSGGKAQPLYSKVLTPEGYKRMGDIHTGDVVFDGDGNLCHVINEFPQGKRPIFEITTKFGNKIRVADNHINSLWWYNSSTKQRVDVELTTVELLYEFTKNYVTKKQDSRRYYRFDNPSVDFESQEVPIDPYLLGLLLGDGSLHGNFDFSNPESDLVDRCNKLLDQYDYELVNYNRDGITWSIRVQKDKFIPGHKTYLRAAIENLHLNVKSTDKFIPKCYLLNSRKIRTSLLQGLFDTDGCIYEDGKCTFSTSSPQLSEDFSFLVRSLGGMDSVVTTLGKYKDDTGAEHVCSLAFEHTIKFNDDTVKFYSSKKHTTRFVPNRRNSWRSILSIKYIGLQECKCILLDSPKHTYISDDFLPTHNTTTAIDVCKHAADQFQKEWEDQCVDLREKQDKESKYKLADLEESGPRKILYLDLEHSFDADWAETLGVDTDKINIMQPPDVPAEEILQMILDMVESNEVGLIVLDSIPSLVPSSVIDKKIGERTVASLAGLMDVFMKKITQLLMRYQTTLLLINQIRDNMDNPYVVNTPGGQAVKFFCSLRMQFTLGNPIDIVGNELPQRSEDPAGYLIKVRIVKQKSAPNNRKGASYFLLNQSGIKPEMDYAQLAIKSYQLIRKSGGWYTVCDPETGEIVENDGRPLKLQGLPRVYEYLETNTEYYNKLKNFIENDINQSDVVKNNNA